MTSPDKGSHLEYKNFFQLSLPILHTLCEFVSLVKYNMTFDQHVSLVNA